MAYNGSGSAPFKRRVYLSTEWIGSTMASIDPLKDAKADEVNITINRTESRRAVVERQGRDFEKLKRELKRNSSSLLEALFKP